MVITTRKVRVTIILISLWTIAQTIFHIFWVITGYLLSICQIKPTYYDVIFIYLTYFYKESCGPIQLRKETFFLKKEAEGLSESSNVLYEFLNDTLHNAQLPEENDLLKRTELYLFLLFVGDSLWIASAISLAIGSYYKTKHKLLSIIFYGPWLLCSVYVSFLDVVSSVQYGIDFIYLKNYTSWLKFIGVSNYNDFQAYDDDSSSSVIPALPTTGVVILLSRGFLIWLLNVICFFVILFWAGPDLFVTSRPSRWTSDNEPGESDFNSTEARIRNWQLFYGAIQANSTLASSSAGTSGGTGSTDHNSNSKIRIVEESKNESGFRRFSDVASGVTSMPDPGVNNINMAVLKSHMPWSYISPEVGLAGKPKPSHTNEETENALVRCTRL